MDLQLGVAPERFGNRDRYWAPQGMYQCQGEFRWLAVSVTSDAEWAAAGRIIGGDTLARRRALREAEDRPRRRRAGPAAVGVGCRRDVVDAFHRLQAVGRPRQPGAGRRPARGRPERGPAGMAPPAHQHRRRHLPPHGPRLRRHPSAWDRGSPALGEDNRYVYQGILGLDDEAYARLVEQRIAVEDYLDADLRPA